ncbi:PhoH family protein [Brevibacterium sp. R8603A2]|uniref:PhoH family protein n=1 Tax=Brevibacterium TaxID=1696 RepID=UPI001FF8DE5B|nr:PhoH family protein [uncultured Brevibacterium sp.]MCK1803741.1 PhoH family protein [Brevibacterium sp. R8603A2]
MDTAAAKGHPLNPASLPSKVRLSVPEGIDLVALFGPAEANLRVLEELAPDVDIHCRERDLTLEGPTDDVDALVTTIGELKKLVAAGHRIDEETVGRVHRMEVPGASASEVLGENILSSRGRTVRPKTFGQHQYVNAIRTHTITFGVGPAGTGKTYLAMAMAVNALQHKDVSRIILTRPAVEAGEKLGFLPGTLNEKIDPYVRPLYDALHDMIEPDRIRLLLDSGTIEVAPLAYMRGRTLNDAFVILDEAQNTTPEQMKMFLTRLGFNSRMVVTGDATQIDLPGGTRSGLKVVRDILSGVDDIAFCELTSKDVVRHSLVSAIVDAYDLWSAAEESAPGRSRKGSRG